MKPRLCRFVTLFIAALCLSLTGCQTRAENNGQIVYEFAGWLRLLVPLAGVVVIPAGWLIRRSVQRIGWGLICLGPVLLVIVAPAMFVDRVVVDELHFECRTGLWWSPSRYDVRFDDLRELQLVEQTVGNRGRRRQEFSFYCVKKGGGQEVFVVSDLMMKAVEEIMQHAKKRGVPVLKLPR